MKVKIQPAIWLQALKVAKKAIVFAKGGYTKAERKELAEDLLELAADLLQDLAADV